MIALELYAELCALMSDTGGDENLEISIAAEKGVSADDWKAAKAGYLAQMSDPADMGKTAMAFMPLYQAALEKKRGGGPPCTLEVYTKVHAHMAFRKNPADSTQKIDYMVVLQENGFTHQAWLECESYWTLRVGDSSLPQYVPEEGNRFRMLMQAESDVILGIVRS